MKKFGIVIEEEKDNKMFAYVLKVSSSDNIYNKLTKITNIKTATIYDTIKKANEVATRLNEIFKEQGRYLYY